MLILIGHGAGFIRCCNKFMQPTHASGYTFLRIRVTFELTSWHTASANAIGMQGTSGLTNIVLYPEVLLSQKTRPDARLSLKLPQPKLPVKTLLGEEETE